MREAEASRIPPLEVASTGFSRKKPFQKPPPITPGSHKPDFLSLCLTLISPNGQNSIFVIIKRQFHLTLRAKRFLGDFCEYFPTLYKGIEP